jgi:hypothetical protein
LRKVSLRPNTGVPGQRQELVMCVHNNSVSSSYTSLGSLFLLCLLSGYFKLRGLCIVQWEDDCELRMIWNEKQFVLQCYFSVCLWRLLRETMKILSSLARFQSSNQPGPQKYRTWVLFWDLMWHGFVCMYYNNVLVLPATFIKFLQNSGTCLPNYVVSHSKTL